MRGMRLAGLVMLAAISFAGMGLAQTADAPIQIKGVKVSEPSQALSVLIETSGPLRYQVTMIDGPARLVIDMWGEYTASKARWTSMPDPIKEIRGSQWKPGTARVVVELTRSVPYHIDETDDGLAVILDQPAAGHISAPEANNSRPLTAGESQPASAKVSTAKADAAKPDAPKADRPRIDAAKPRGPADTPDPASLESVKADTPKPDAATPPLSKDRASKIDSGSKREATLLTPAKPDMPAGAPARPDASRAIAKGEPAAAATIVTLPAAPPAQPVRVAQASPPAGGQPPAPPAPGPGGAKTITLDFKDADVVNVLRLLGAEGGRNLVVGDDVKGKVSVSLRNVTWDQALETILEARGLQRIERGGVLRIVSNEQLTKEREAQARADEARQKAEIEVRTKKLEAEIKESELAARRAATDAAAAEAQARGPLREEVIRLAYADPEEVTKTLQGILGIPPTGTMPVGGPMGPPGAGLLPRDTGGAPYIAEPPFSALYGPGAQQPPTLVSVSQDALAKGITITPNKATNSIFLRLYQRDLEQIKRLIREYFDVPLPQVKIEARMEILDRSALESIGIQWGGGGATNTGKATLIGQGFGQPNTGTGTGPSNFSPANSNLNLSSLLPVTPGTGLPAGGNLVNLPLSGLPLSALVNPTAGIAFGIVGTNFNVNLALQALSTIGKTRTLARPEIVTVENNRATMSLGEEIPYATVSSAGTQVQFKDALLSLTVTPTVIRERIEGRENTRIKMVVVVENNDRGQVVNLGTSGSPPAINKRKAETLVLMNEGERLVIGGVMQSVIQNTVNKVPALGDVPVLGWLFKAHEDSETGRELVVFVTPSVLRAPVAPQVIGK